MSAGPPAKRPCKGLAGVLLLEPPKDTGDRMSAKLFAAGAVLTVLAFASEKHVPAHKGSEPDQAETTTLATEVVSGVERVFDQVTSNAVRRMLEQTDRSMEQLRAVVHTTQGTRGEQVRAQYAKAEALSLRAKQELEAGRAFKALDLVLAANGRIGSIRREFERE